MKKYSNYKSNYDKYPVVQVSETSENVCWQGWPEIVSQLNKSLENVHKPVKVLVVECYRGGKIGVEGTTSPYIMVGRFFGHENFGRDQFVFEVRYNR